MVLADREEVEVGVVATAATAEVAARQSSVEPQIISACPKRLRVRLTMTHFR